jgi:2-polyprenyl-3-methyl-5-hydroxy-6-metoxy-1,4-benzoquinol methylase
MLRRLLGMKEMDRQTHAQESEYSFPYHYIPTAGAGKFSSTRHWDWGFRYLGGLHLVLDSLAAAPFSSLVDVGCGDGRFLCEVAQRLPGRRLLGVDASARAVRLAQALNPNIEYRALDITQGLPERFEAATLIEVLEHISPAQLPEFIGAVAALLAHGGRLIVTVPHRNKPLIEKHHQHFTGAALTGFLAPHFTDIRLIPFDVRSSRSPLMWLIERLLGQKGRWFTFTQQRVLHRLYRLYLQRYLYARTEADCERIAAVCVKNAA